MEMVLVQSPTATATTMKLGRIAITEIPPKESERIERFAGKASQGSAILFSAGQYEAVHHAIMAVDIPVALLRAARASWRDGRRQQCGRSPHPVDDSGERSRRVHGD